MNDIIKFEDTEYIKSVEIKKNDEIESRKKTLDDLEKKITDIEIKSNSEFGLSTDLNKQIKDVIKNIENYRKELVTPMNNEVKKINTPLKNIIKRAENIKIILERKIIQYNKILQAEAEKQAEIQRKKEIEDLEKKKDIAKMQASFLEDEEKEEKIIESYNDAIEQKKEAPIEIKSSFNTGKTQTNIIKKWTYEIIESLDIPKEFCSPDHKKIMTGIDMGIRNIAGLKIYQKDIVSSRNAK